jgi:uncharacterized membrane protein
MPSVSKRMDGQTGISKAQIHRKSLVFACIAVIGSVSGNVLLRAGLRQTGPLLSGSPLTYLEVLANPLVGLGILLLAVWFLASLSLYSWADLSYVLPITALGYALAALTGWAFLGEFVTVRHWIGIGLITMGCMIVSHDHPRGGL